MYARLLCGGLVFGACSLCQAMAVAPFEPSHVSGLSVWLDANDSGTVHTTAGVVDTWDDKSANGYVFTRDTNGGNDPTLVDDQVGGLAAVDFDGTDSVSVSETDADGPLDFSDSLNFFAVIRVDGADNETITSTTSYAHIWQAHYLGSPAVSMYSGNPANAGWQHSNAVDWGTSFHILEVFVDTGNAGDDLRFFVDGELVGSKADYMGVIDLPNSTLWVGQQSGVNFLDGAISELVMYKASLSDTDRNEVGWYLQDKYGLEGSYVPEPAAAMLSLVLAGGLAMRRGK